MKRAWLVLALVVASLSAGCVTRRIVITSDPPGAIVYRDGQPIGATPVEEPFIYYGKFRYRLVKDGYQPLDVEPDVCAPWYEWPGIDFVSENVVPVNIRDIRPFHYQLLPLEVVRPDDVRARAEALRARGALIQPPPEAQPRPQRIIAPPPPAPPPSSLPVPTGPPHVIPAPLSSALPLASPAVTLGVPSRLGP
jgi:hypothetical protein